MAGARRPADQSLKPGERLGSYDLLALLGAGAMGLVFRARRDRDESSVALKILREELTGDRLYRRRFEREARIASEVRHKRLVPVLDYGEVSGRLYLAAHFVRGESLMERIASRGPLPLAEGVLVAGDVAGALAALHAEGLVHRDVKPANVMLDERGRAALTDFGLARGIAETVLTKTGVVVGTVDYLAPELIRGEQATPSSDVYALGVLVYECFAGAPPFVRDSYVETLLAHVTEAPVDPREHRPDLPEALCWTVVKALAKDPAERPATAKEYARLLRVSAKTG